MNAMPLDAPPPVRWGDDLIRVYRERYRDLVRLAYLLTRQAAIAEEIVQDAFVASHGKCDTVRDPYAYVRAAVVNRCYSHGRRLKLERERRPGAPDPARLVADEMWDAPRSTTASGPPSCSATTRTCRTPPSPRSWAAAPPPCAPPSTAGSSHCGR